MGEFLRYLSQRSSGSMRTRYWITRRDFRVAVLACLVLAGMFLLPSTPAKAATGINQQINYQARLLNSQGAVVPDGNYNIQFKIYKNGDGLSAGDTTGTPAGTLLWTENWQNSNSQYVTVKNGYFSVQLGSICPLTGGSCQGNTNTGVDFNQSVLYLSVNIGGTSTGASPTYDGEMLPMRQMAASPYALNSNMLGGLTASQFVQFAPNLVQADSSTNSSIFINKTGSSGYIVELQNSGTDVVTISKTGVINTTGGLSIAGTSVCDTVGGTGCVAKSGSGFYIHNQTGTVAGGTVQAGNIALQGSSSAAPAAQIAAASGGSGDILDLQNSSGTNVVTVNNVGVTTVKTSTDNANAFQVQDHNGNSVINVDTSNGRVGIGQATPSRLFDIAQNSSQVTAPMALLEQNGTGDVAIELKSATAGNSFYIGQDTSNSGGFSINSSTAATSSQATPTHVQTATSIFFTSGATSTTASFASANTAGNLIVAAATWDETNSQNITCSDTKGNSYTTVLVKRDVSGTQDLGICYAANIASGSGNVVSVSYGASTVARKISIHEYSGVATSSPVDVFTSTIGTGATGANGYTSTAATTTQDGDLIFGAMFDDQSSPGTVTAGTSPLTFAAHYTGSDGMLAEEAVQSTAGSVSASFTNTVAHTYLAVMVAFKRGLATNTLTDTNTNSLFTLSQTGGAKFQNISNSTSAFVIQNASGTQLFNVDTSQSRVTIGNGATGSATPALLILNSSNVSADPGSAVAGAMYYNASTGNFRCFQNGLWQNCLGGLTAVSTSVTTVNNCSTACGAVATITSGWVANYCTVGHTYHIYASGILGFTTASTNIAMSLYIGTNAAKASDTLLGAAGNAAVLPSTTANNLGWELDAYLICNSTTSVMVHGSTSFLTSASTGAVISSKIAPINVATTITNATQNLYLFPAWGAASSTNSISCSQFVVQAL